MTEMIEEKKAQGEPLVVMFVGINGTGKTTTIGKLANYYLKKGYTPVIAASDTFRAGAIEQVTHHADNVGVKIIKHKKGSDPAAVAPEVEKARDEVARNTGELLSKRREEIELLQGECDDLKAQLKMCEIEMKQMQEEHMRRVDSLLDDLRKSRSVLDDVYRQLLEYKLIK